jgi:uncharacterized membrane protein YeaQ/YmgE (transglycosylase-associated protein family)
MDAIVDWLAPFCFGIVIGWIVYRTLRRSQTNGVSDLATVIGAVGGAGVTAIFTKDHGDFSRYCLGLFVGFFGYLIVGARVSDAPVAAWLGHEARQNGPKGPVLPAPDARSGHEIGQTDPTEPVFPKAD